ALHVEDDPDGAEVPVEALPVEPVSDEVLVAYLESPILDGHVGEPTTALVEQCGRGDAGRPPVGDHPAEGGQGETGVDDVLDDYDVAIEEWGRGVERQPDPASLAEPVEPEKVDLGVHRDAADEIGPERDRAVEDHQEERV